MDDSKFTTVRKKNEGAAEIPSPEVEAVWLPLGTLGNINPWKSVFRQA